MTRHYSRIAVAGLVVTGFAVGLVGCTETPPPAPLAGASQAEAPKTPESEKPKVKGKKAPDPRLDLGVKEMRELRRKEKEAAGKGS